MIKPRFDLPPRCPCGLVWSNCLHPNCETYRALLKAAHDVRDVHMEGQPDWAEVYAKIDK